jgi:hypothetical protein
MRKEGTRGTKRAREEVLIHPCLVDLIILAGVMAGILKYPMLTRYAGRDIPEARNETHSSRGAQGDSRR